jgi:hypothetical protein
MTKQKSFKYSQEARDAMALAQREYRKHKKLEAAKLPAQTASSVNPETRCDSSTEVTLNE